MFSGDEGQRAQPNNDSISSNVTEPAQLPPVGQVSQSQLRGSSDVAFKYWVLKEHDFSPVVSQREELTLHSLMTFVSPTLWTWTYMRVSRRSAPAGTIAVGIALEVLCVTTFLRNS